MKTQHKYFFSIFVNIVIPIGGFSTDLYIPSLPAITSHFMTNKALVQYTFTSFAMAMALSQLIVGPLSDALGRKKLLVGSIIFQALSIFAILYSTTIYQMITFRFIQGLAVGFLLVPAGAILSDIFKGDQFKKQMNYLTIAYAIGPIVAPFIGGYLQHYFGWRSNFYFLLIYLLPLLLLTLFAYKETINTKHPLSITHMLHNYKIVLGTAKFIVPALFAGSLYCFTALFIVTGPFLIQQGLGKTAITYGHVALLIGLAWFLGNLINRVTFQVADKIKTPIILSIILLTTLIMWGIAGMGYFNLMLLVVPTFIVVMAAATLFSATVAETLSLFPERAASSYACFFSIAWATYGLFSIIASFLHAYSLIPFAVTGFLSGLLMLGIYLGIIRMRKLPSQHK